MTRPQVTEQTQRTQSTRRKEYQILENPGFPLLSALLFLCYSVVNKKPHLSPPPYRLSILEHGGPACYPVSYPGSIPTD